MAGFWGWDGAAWKSSKSSSSSSSFAPVPLEAVAVFVLVCCPSPSNESKSPNKSFCGSFLDAFALTLEELVVGFDVAWDEEACTSYSSKLSLPVAPLL